MYCLLKSSAIVGAEPCNVVTYEISAFGFTALVYIWANRKKWYLEKAFRVSLFLIPFQLIVDDRTHYRIPALRQWIVNQEFKNSPSINLPCASSTIIEAGKRNLCFAQKAHNISSSHFNSYGKFPRPLNLKPRCFNISNDRGYLNVRRIRNESKKNANQ
jgi:hypothetical protein